MGVAVDEAGGVYGDPVGTSAAIMAVKAEAAVAPSTRRWSTQMMPHDAGSDAAEAGHVVADIAAQRPGRRKRRLR